MHVLEAFMGIVKEGRKEVRQEVAPGHACILAWFSAVLLHCSCLFSCQVTCSQTTYLPLLALLLEWLFLSALEILRNVEENCPFPSPCLLLQFSGVKLNGGVRCLPAENPCHLELLCGPTCNLHSSLPTLTKPLYPSDEWVH